MIINRHFGDFTESKKSPFFWKLQIGGWISYTLLGGIVAWFMLTYGTIPASHHAEIYSLILCTSLFGFVITSSLRPLLIWIHSKRWHPAILLVLICISSVLIATLELQLMIRVPFLRHSLDGLRSIKLLDTGFTNVWILWKAFIFLMWQAVYFGASLWSDSIELISRQQKSELSLLRYQMQPHFLFNALTGLMAVSGDKQKVEELTQSLADYLRFSLSKSDDDASPLGDELDALESYLQVEKIRFAENLNYRINADQEARAFSVPSQLVQPLLENAIKYGQQTSPMPLSILIQARRNGDKLQLLIENTGLWVDASASSCNQGMGIGISNLRRRLQLLYGDRASLTHEHSPQRVQAMVTIPIMKT
jgi:signal transduction histidine kinase